MSLQEKAIEVGVAHIRGYFVPSKAERAAAYELLIELATRTSTTPLGSSPGLIRDALDGMHAMFGITRGILRSHGGGAAKGTVGNLSLSVISVRVLNEVMRPVLGRWHPSLLAYEGRRTTEAPEMSPVEWERCWPLAEQCRNEINEMRRGVRAYIDTLGRIAGASGLADSMLAAPASRIFEQVVLKPPAAVVSEDTSRSRFARRLLGPQQKVIEPDLMAGRKPRQKMVRWLALHDMVSVGRASRRAKVDTKAFARVSSAEPKGPTVTFPVEKGEEFWFDYVADTGDAFDGVAPIAWLMGRREITIPNDPAQELPPAPAFLPRGRLVVFGGDEVYPSASAEGYRNQTELPFHLCYERDESLTSTETTEEPAPVVLAIPGNHDWFGGIGDFDNMFTRPTAREADPGFAGIWKVVQPYRWWHALLPHGWWLWGIDTALDNKMPEGEVAYFAEAAKALRPGDRVILCTPIPLWQLRQRFPDDYTALRSQLDPLIAARGATMPLCLSGDSHFFAYVERVGGVPEDHVTAGGGGAFLQPTHGIPERIPSERGNAEFVVTARWPPPADSRALAPKTIPVRDGQTWSIAGVSAALHALFILLVATRSAHLPWSPGKDDPNNWRNALSWTSASPWALILLIVLIVAGKFVFSGDSREHRLTAAAHTYGYLLGICLAATLLLDAFLLRLVRRESPALLLVLLFAVVGGLVSAAVFFAGANFTNRQLKAGGTLAFSRAHSTRFKHFVRCRIDTNGDLTCYVVGVDPSGKNWFDALTKTPCVVPPADPAGIPRIHYVWGKTYRRFEPKQTAVAISISDPAGAEADARKSIFFRVGKGLIMRGHTIIYGGLPPKMDTQMQNYTAMLHDAEEEVHHGNPNAVRHLVNYVPDKDWREAYPTEPGQPETTRDDGVMKSIRVQRQKVEGETVTAGYIRDLSAMRRRTVTDSRARIVIGGNNKPGDPHERLAPGVIEEAYLSLLARQPLLIAGGFGGAAGLLADALLGRGDRTELQLLAGHFADPDPRPDGSSGAAFIEMVTAFNSLGQLRNGLSDGENRELLCSHDVATVAALIQRGIDNIAAHRTGD